MECLRGLGLLVLLGAAGAVPRGLEAALKRIAVAESAKYNCSVSIAYRDAWGVATAAHGVIDFATGRQAQTSDSYAFGSVTKVLTGASVLRLVSEGRLSLDGEVAPLVDPILGAMADADRSQGFRSLAELWGAENVSGTTIRQLLSMTSGIPDFDTATPCFPGQQACVPTDLLRQTLYENPADAYGPPRLMSVPWVAHQWKGPCQKAFKKGMKPFCYSSTNFMLLGLVLAAQAKDGSWTSFDQASYLPSSVKGELQFAKSGAPRDYTPVHGYDRTTYNMPAGERNSHDNWEVDGVFSGWTASDIVAPVAAIANLTWEVYGPPKAIVPQGFAELMIPGDVDIYGLATFNLGQNTGQRGRYGVAYGHLGATYGYQSVTAYFPGLDFALTVATNIETDYQEQPADAMCMAYNAAAGLLLKRTIRCTFQAGSYYGGGCVCDPLEPEGEATILL